MISAAERFYAITPHLVVRDIAQAVAFYARVRGRGAYRNLAPDGVSIVNSELLLGDSRYFVNEEFPEHDQRSPLAHGGPAVTLHLCVANVDALFARAVAAGAEIMIDSPTSSGATATVAYAIPSGTSGRWPVASKTAHPMRYISGPPTCSVPGTYLPPAADRASIPSGMIFRATVELGGKTVTGIEVPAEVVAALGSSKRPAVLVTVGAHSYRTTVASMGGRFLVPLNVGNRAAAGVSAGDQVDIEVDTAARTIALPRDLDAP